MTNAIDIVLLAGSVMILYGAFYELSEKADITLTCVLVGSYLLAKTL